MTAWMAAFCAGVIILYCSGVLLAWTHYIFVAVLVLATCLPRFLIPFLLLLAGWFYASLVAQSHQADIDFLADQNKTVEVIGFACSLPKQRRFNQAIRFCARALSDDSGQSWVAIHSRMDLRWLEDTQLNVEEAFWRLRVELQAPHSTANATGVSYEQYLFYQRIAARGRIKEQLSLQHQWHPGGLDQLLYRANRQRWIIGERLVEAIGDLEHYGTLRALILGDRSALSDQEHRLLQQTGTQHLMAISGLHVGIVLLVFGAALRPGIAGLLLIAVLSFAYIVLVGFPASAQRAWMMGMCILLVRERGWRVSPFKGYLLALTVVLLLDPLVTLSLGFWYSFYAVFWLLCLAALFEYRFNLTMLFAVQLFMTLALVALSSLFGLAHFGASVPANLVAIPWVSLVILPGALLAFLVSLVSPEAGALLFSALDLCLHGLYAYFESLRTINFPFKLESSLLAGLSYASILLVMLMVWRQSFFRVITIAILVLYLVVPSRIAQHQGHELVVFDAGQGLAMFVRHGEWTWLFDSGPQYGRYSVAESAIAPYLSRQHQLNSMTGMLLSHGDSDHTGQADALISRFDPIYRWSGEPERLPSHSRFTACYTGQRWQQHRLAIEVLFPPLGYVPNSSNNASCVVMLTLDRVRFLMMGDLEGKGELDFLRQYQGDLQADVLIAGHHGSRFATSHALLKRVNPRYVVFSAGYQNRFGHPHQAVVDRVLWYGAKPLMTSETGAIRFGLRDFDAQAVPPELHIDVLRDEDRPFWMQGKSSGE